MAKAKKTRKRYNPRKQTRLSDDFNLERYVQAKNSDEDVPEATVSSYRAKLEYFTSALKQGRLKRSEFMGLSEFLHFYGCILLHLRPMRLNRDEQQNTLLKLTLSTRTDFALNTVPDALEAIGDRFKKHGRFVAGGEEIKIIDRFAEELIETLGFIRQRDFIAAFEMSERELRDCPHRTGRFKPLKEANAA